MNLIESVSEDFPSFSCIIQKGMIQMQKITLTKS